VPLKEGGDTLPVSQENKREFVQLSAQYRLYSSIKDQIENLLAGFYEIIPKDLVTIVSQLNDVPSSLTHMWMYHSSMSKNSSFLFLARRILTWMNGVLRLNIMATPALTQSLFGGGELSNLSTVMRGRKCSALQRVPLAYLSAAS
jgi:hypothetical protein